MVSPRFLGLLVFDKILIANRGEIACRVARTARRLGIRTVAVYSDVDKNALHVAACDEAALIGAAHPRDSYLRGGRIIEVALATGAQAIHPGYGFLSENADFADACVRAGLVFIGPPASAIRAMGLKSAAKALMQTAGVPLVPGYHGDAQDIGTLRKATTEIGYPLLIKASAGGGGKGMRIVRDAGEFETALAGAKREAAAAFGNDAVLIEKYLHRPRHIEIQVFADQHGNAVYLFERDCSVQRRHQKVLEEAPAPAMTSQRRRQMGSAAVAAARAVNYTGAGTVEFIVDQAGEFFFMEMNTRLQVEHPVTEMITGLDLVEWQLRVAAGAALPHTQEQLQLRGHAIEARVYAEDVERGFLPAPGTIGHLREPVGSTHVRVDTGVRAGDEVRVHYDPMIAKVIAWGEDRGEALRRLRAALAEYQIVGLMTNLGFLQDLIALPDFAQAQDHPERLDTGLIERNAAALVGREHSLDRRLLVLAALWELLDMETRARTHARASADPFSPWHRRDGWRLNQDNHHALVFHHGEQRLSVIAHFRAPGFEFDLSGQLIVASATLDADGNLDAQLDGTRCRATVIRQGDALAVFAFGTSCSLLCERPAHAHDEGGLGGLISPLPGSVIQLLVKSGDAVQQGQALMIIEAMKMEHTIVAPAAGTVTQIYFAKGEQVKEGAELLALDLENTE